MNKCPLCKSVNRDLIRVGVREDPEIEVFRCSDCTLVYIDPPFDDAQQYYSHEYRKEHNPVPWAEMTAQQRYEYYRPLMDKRLHHFVKHVPMGCRVLEVGCSAGHYLDVIANSGYEARGCDYNPDDVAFVNDTLMIPCEVGDIDTAFPGKKFGAICAYHVLEHVVDPVAWVKSAYERLEDGGILYVQVPNLDDALVSIYQIPEFINRWYRIPHLSYFDKQTLRKLVYDAGFDVDISYDQLYSLGNHFSWALTKKPMPDPASAQEPMVLADQLGLVFHWMDEGYRKYLIDGGVSDLLIAIGKKRGTS